MRNKISRIRFIEQANAGPGAARNKALDIARDDTACVAFLDSDDVWAAMIDAPLGPAEIAGKSWTWYDLVSGPK